MPTSAQEVVGDDRLELGHRVEFALDDVVAALAGGRVVDEPHDAEDALAVDDALAGADRVAGELDALVGLAGAPRLGDGRRSRRASLPGRAGSVAGRLDSLDDLRASSPRPRAMSSWTARISRRRSATGSGRRRLSVSIARDASARVLGDDEGDAALEGELAQVALLAGCRWRSGGLGGWVVIGHGRAWARRAGPSSPGPSGLAQRPAGQGLTAPMRAVLRLADRTEHHPRASLRGGVG